MVWFWHAEPRLSPTLALEKLFFYSLCVVPFPTPPAPALVMAPARKKTQVSGQNKKKRGGETGRPVEICRELCLTKCANIILSSRISTHASKVHLPFSFSQPPFFFFSLSLSTVAGVGWFPWRPSAQHNLRVSHSGE